MAKKYRKRWMYPVTALALSVSILTPPIDSPFKFTNHKVLAAEQETTINDKKYYIENQKNAINRLNQIRKQIGLNEVLQHASLTDSAQAHSNYASYHQSASHSQNKYNVLFTGTYVQDRTAAYGYTGKVNEVMSFQNTNSATGVDRLIDAPYHRVMLLDSTLTDIGVGLTIDSAGFNPTVINVGMKEQKEVDTVLYPSNGQTNVKVGWYANESPNPLRFENINKVFTGYPITISHYGNDIFQTKANNISLTNDKGESIPFYYIDSTKDPSMKAVFIIPKNPLDNSTEYFVEADIVQTLKNGDTKQDYLNWNFSTVDKPSVQYMELQGSKENPVFKVYTTDGDREDLSFSIVKDGKIVQSFKDQKYLSYEKIGNGTYDLRITSEAEIIEIPISIKDGIVTDESRKNEAPSPEEPELPKEDSLDEDPVDNETPSPEEPEKPEESEEPEQPIEDKKIFKTIKEMTLDSFKSAIIKFSVALAKSTLNNSIFMKDKNGKNVPIEWKLSDDGKSVEINPVGPLLLGETYELFIDDSIRGTKGQKLLEAIKYIFHIKPQEEPPVTGDTPKEEEPPVAGDTPKEEEPPVTGDTPKEEEPPVTGEDPKEEEPPATGDTPKEEKPVTGEDPKEEEPPTTDGETPTEDEGSDQEYITIKEIIIKTFPGAKLPFSAPLDKDTVNNQSFMFKDENGNNVPMDWTISKDFKTLEIKSMDDLQPGKYELLISDSIKGKNGEKIGQPIKYIFNVTEKKEEQNEDLSKEESPSKETSGNEDEKENPSSNIYTNEYLSKFIERFKGINGVPQTQKFGIPLTVQVDLDTTTVNNKSVFVLDNNNNVVPIEVGVVNNKIQVSPKTLWESGGAYTIYLDDTIKVTSGRKVESAVKYSFTVK